MRFSSFASKRGRATTSPKIENASSRCRVSTVSETVLESRVRVGAEVGADIVEGT